MGADVALGERAIERVGERVQADVGVGMSAERRRNGGCGRRTATSRRRARKRGRRSPGRPASRLSVAVSLASAASRSCMVVTLTLSGIAFEHVSRRARPFGDRDVVGEVADAGGRGAPMRREDEGKAEGLRRLHGPQARARRGREHPAVGVDLLDGVAHRRSRRRRAVSLGGFDRPRDEGRGGEGPRRVVDEDDLRLGRGDGLEAGQNALLARRAADRRGRERRRRAWPQMRHRLVIERPVVGVDDHRYGGERKARGQRLERMRDQRALRASSNIASAGPRRALTPGPRRRRGARP